MNETKKEVIDIIDSIENNKIENTNEIRVKNKMLEVRENLADFLIHLLQSSMQDDQLLRDAKDRMTQLIPTLEFKDIIYLINSLEKNKSNKDSNLTDLLKPNQQSASPLLEVFSEIKEKEQDNFEKTFNESDSKDLREIDKLDKILTKLAELSGQENENKTDQN